MSKDSTRKGLSKPKPLDITHNCSDFNCGEEALNNYLKKFALNNALNSSAKTYVTTDGDNVVGYYTIVAGSVNREEAPERIKKGLGAYPIPVILIARLAIDLKFQNQGIGKALLKDSIIRISRAADIIGCRAILVHAKDDQVVRFYKKYGFEPSPISNSHLYLLIKDVKLILDFEEG